jgi:hypothetical protein
MTKKKTNTENIDALIICTEKGYEAISKEFGDKFSERVTGVSIMDDKEYFDFIDELQANN